MDISILIVAILTLIVTTAFFVYQIRKDKKEIEVSIIPECVDQPYANYWFLDISSCGNRSISISSDVKITLSDGEHTLTIIKNNLLTPGGLHNHTERKHCQWLINKEIISIVISEMSGKKYKVDNKNLRLLRKIVREYEKQN